MTDKSEQFREIPAIRGMLADPMKTSREIEDIKNNLRRVPDYSQVSKAMDDKLMISNNRFSEMLSDSIINNQRDYQDLSYNIDNLNDTYQDIWFEMQMRMEDEIEEMKWVKKQMQIKNNMAKKRIEQNEETNEYLDSIDQSMNDTRKWVDWTNRHLEEMKNNLNREFRKTQNYLSSLNVSNQNMNKFTTRMAQVSYGTSIPEKKTIDELMKNTDYEWKKTLLALYAKNLVKKDTDNRSVLASIFRYRFIDYTSKDITSEQAIDIRANEQENIQELEEQYSYEYDILIKEKRSEDDILEKLAPLQKKISDMIEYLFTDEEIEFLDIYQEAKTAENIVDLINMWMIEDTTLEKLLRNQTITGESSLQIARIMKMDENGINPKIDLDGDVGKRQQLKAQTIQGNIALGQRQSMLEGISEWNQLTTITNDILLEVKNELSEWNELAKITNDILLEVKNELSEALYSIWDVLQNIWDTLIQWFSEISEELSSIRYVNQNILEELQQQTQLLEEINTNLLQPLDIKANEFYIHWVYWAKIKEWRNAFESFRKWLDEKSIHLWNLYWAGTAKMMLWEDKEAAKYLLRSYKVAKEDSKHEIVSKIALDIAKINTKYLRLKLAKRRLNESIRSDKWNMEAFLLKARITKMLGQKKEFEELLQIMYNEIICEWNDKNIPKNYADIFKYFHKPIDITTKEEIIAWWTSKLIKIMSRVENIWYRKWAETILWEILFKNPWAVKKSWTNIGLILTSNKALFTKEYKEFVQKDYVWWKSIDLFTLAYLGYQYIDFGIIRNVIKKGLEFDEDYINLKNAHDIQSKKIHLQKIKIKIYALWDNAKYMLRDYVINNPGSLLNI